MHPSRIPSVPPAPRAADVAGPDEPTLVGPAGRVPAEDPAGAEPSPGPTTGAASEPAGGAA